MYTQRFQQLVDRSAKLAHMLQRAIALEELEAGNRGRARNRISGIRMSVKEFVSAKCVENPLFNNGSRNRQRPAAQSLPDADDVGMQSELLVREHRPRPA